MVVLLPVQLLLPAGDYVGLLPSPALLLGPDTPGTGRAME
jgi:hypothetical protein